MKRYRFKISFNDRIGMARDVAAVVAGLGVNIVSLEVKPGEMYLQIGYVEDPVLQTIIERIRAQDGVKEVAPIDWLHHELEQKRLKSIIDSVEEGILVTDQEGRIVMYNQRAVELLSPEGYLIGSTLREAGFPKEVADSIASDHLHRQEVILHLPPRGHSRFMVKSVKITDEYGIDGGSMITFEKLCKAQKRAHLLTHPVMTTFDDIVYTGRQMSAVIDLAKRVAGGDSTVLIRGESGTGKELFARAIHMASNRSEQPFVVVNCAAIPETLLESELFGYTDGTFTGGRKGGRQGLFEYADSGTIFLDEVAEMPSYLQAKLLRVLQDGCIRRLGDVLENKVDVRVVAATNRDLDEMVREGKLREDLFYRLNVIPIFIPPLRQHKEDIPALVRHFVGKFNDRLEKNVQSISHGALERLSDYHWPGNIRELENIVERAMNLVNGDELKEEHILLPGEGKIVSFNSRGRGLKKELAVFEKRALIEALKKSKSARQAAKILGVSHTTVINKMRRYHLDGRDY